MVWYIAILNFPNVIIGPLITFHQVKNTFPSENVVNVISIVTDEKNQGVAFDGDLKFLSHVNQIVSKAITEYWGTILVYVPLPPCICHKLKIVVYHSCLPNYGLHIGILILLKTSMN